LNEPREVAPPPNARKHWTRKLIAEWLVERLSETALTLAGIDHGFSFPLRYFEKYKQPRDWPSFMDDFQSTGRQMRTTPTSISFVKVSVEMARPAVVILAGGESRKYVRTQNPSFILTCRARLPNQRTPVFRGCVISAFTREIEFIFGRSMAGRCCWANQQLSKFIRPYGATASRAMAAALISKTHMPRRNGFAEMIWRATWNGFSIQACPSMNEKWPKSKAGF